MATENIRDMSNWEYLWQNRDKNLCPNCHNLNYPYSIKCWYCNHKLLHQGEFE